MEPADPFNCADVVKEPFTPSSAACQIKQTL